MGQCKTLPANKIHAHLKICFIKFHSTLNTEIRFKYLSYSVCMISQGRLKSKLITCVLGPPYLPAGVSQHGIPVD